MVQIKVDSEIMVKLVTEQLHVIFTPEPEEEIHMGDLIDIFVEDFPDAVYQVMVKFIIRGTTSGIKEGTILIGI